MTTRIRAATDQERSAVVVLWHDCGLTRPWNDPDADFAAALGNATSTVLVLNDGEQLLGTVMVGYDGHRGWLYYLAVPDQHQGHGHGRRLVAAAEDWLTDRGAVKVQLMIREGNSVGKFYAALGYQAQAVTTWGRRLTEA